MLGGSHLLSENQRWFWVQFSVRTGQWESKMRTGLKVLTGDENSSRFHLASKLRTEPVLTFWEGSDSHGKQRNQILALCKKSCPVGPELHPPFDASFPFGCCQQSHEFVLNKGMKYWDSALNASGSRTFIATEHIAAAAIGWKRSGNERIGKLSLAPNLLPNWVLWHKKNVDGKKRNMKKPKNNVITYSKGRRGRFSWSFFHPSVPSSIQSIHLSIHKQWPIALFL